MEGDGWLHEIKYDGWRLMARKNGKDVRLYTRGGIEWSAKLPKLTAAIRALDVRSAWLDGELVYLDESGYPRFETLHSAIRASNEARLFFQTWDVLWQNGRCVTARPLIERKNLLARVLAGALPRLRFTEHVVGQGAAFFRAADAHDLEGIVSKRSDSLYHVGERTRDWLKTKCWRTCRFVVGGIEHDANGRLAALLVGSPASSGLKYEGRVEFGLHRVRSTWADARTSRECPFTQDMRSRGRTWLVPSALIEVRALPRILNGQLRHATAVRTLDH